MRRDVASTLIQRHFGTKCPLGRVDLDCKSYQSLLFTGYFKGEKERLITCTNAQANRVLTIRTLIVFFHVSEPNPRP